MQEAVLTCKTVIQRKDNELSYALEQTAELRQLMVQMNIKGIAGDYAELERNRRIASTSQTQSDVSKLHQAVASLTDENNRLMH